MVTGILAIVVVILIVLLYVRHAKTVRKVLGTIIGTIVFIILLAFTFTAGLPKVADTMFADIHAGNMEQAYATTAKGFQANTTLDQFKTFVQQTNLATFKEASWTDREVMNNQGILKGTVTLSDNTKLPFEINLVKEDGTWKIFTMQIPQGGLTDQTATGTEEGAIPTQEATTVLVNDAMGRFADAVLKGDFSNFYTKISDTWKGQITVAQFNEAFKTLIDAKLNLTFTKTATPIFAAMPTLDANGILDVQGTFQATDGKVLFDIKYIQEGGQRKLFGIQVKTAK